jgi:hypothetical protein
MENSVPDDMLSWDNLIYIADLIQSTGGNHISLLGGEPFLHPEIADFILYLNQRGLSVAIFTSGVIPEKNFDEIQSKLLSVPDLKLTFICNVNEPTKAQSLELLKVRHFLEVFGHLTSLSYNIYKIDFKLDFLFNYIIEYGLNRHIRFGLAHPIVGKNNMFIPTAQFGKMKAALLHYLPFFEKYQVEPGFDCGFPLCIFSDDEIGSLYKVSGGRLTFKCGPAIDIGPDMQVWSCFPLSDFHKKSLFEFDSIDEIAGFYDQKLNEVRQEAGGIFIECDACKHRKSGLCSGGCISHVLSAIDKENQLVKRRNYEK